MAIDFSTGSFSRFFCCCVRLSFSSHLGVLRKRDHLPVWAVLSAPSHLLPSTFSASLLPSSTVLAKALFLVPLPSTLFVTSSSPGVIWNSGLSLSYLGVLSLSRFRLVSCMQKQGSASLIGCFLSRSSSSLFVLSGHHGRRCTFVQYLSQTSLLQRCLSLVDSRLLKGPLVQLLQAPDTQSTGTASRGIVGRL